MKNKKVKNMEENKVQNDDRDYAALQDLAAAMAKYEETTGHCITNLAIDQNPETEKNEVREMPSFDDEECVPNGAADIVANAIANIRGLTPTRLDEARSLTDQYVTDNIRRLFPVSTQSNETDLYEATHNNPDMRVFLADKRLHDKVMAQSIGQIAEATAAMLLEYQTQSIAHAVGDGSIAQIDRTDKENGAKLFNPYNIIEEAGF